MKKNDIYKTVNIIVIAMSILFFAYRYWNWREIFNCKFNTAIITLIITVILVNILKMFRLFLALYGSEISLKDYLITYIKVTPVSILVPFKLGELFRIYCYGSEINNILKGIVVILLDRFMDTIALITVVFGLCIIMGGQVTSVVYFLIIFLIVLSIIYIVFPGLYRFWKKYLIDCKASVHKMWALELIEKINSVYTEIEGVVKGRGIVMYGISLVAWMIEIGNLAILSRLYGNTDLVFEVNQYLTGTLGGVTIPELNGFSFVCIIFLIAMYIFIKVIGIVKRGKNK